MSRGESGWVGRNRARSEWFVALSGKSALIRGSLIAHSGHWGEICTLMIRGSHRGRVGAIRSAIGLHRGGVVAHSCLVGAHSGQTNKIQISTVAFLARSWHVLGRLVVKSCWVGGDSWWFGGQHYRELVAPSGLFLDSVTTNPNSTPNVPICRGESAPCWFGALSDYSGMCNGGFTGNKLLIWPPSQ